MTAMNYYVDPISETEWHVKRDRPAGTVAVYGNPIDAEEHCEWLNYYGAEPS